MSKYSNEFKLKVVNYCLENNVGYRRAANYFNIPSKTLVERWVQKYKKHGPAGLFKNPTTIYSGDFKINVIKYMYDNHLSYSETAVHFNLAGSDIIGKWLRIYNKKGIEALYRERRGRSKNMISKPRKKELSESNEKELIAEIQQLRMENAYLKKLDALVQERIKRENPKKQ